MVKLKTPFAHLKNSKSLITPYENTRAGFVQMALEKSSRATPHVAQARDLAEQIKRAKKALDLLKMDGIQGALLTAAGISDKAVGHFDPATHVETIQKLVENYLVTSGAGFREELVYRFLLTRGDSLGGAMRNVVGVLAQRRFTSMLIARMRNSGLAFTYRTGNTKSWEPSSTSNKLPDLEDIKYLAWQTNKGYRILAYNLKIASVGNNVDMSLVDCKTSDFSALILKDPKVFIALGELKGGIDPAGADEHWKTASTALSRIRSGFSKAKCKPKLFFIGAAIEQSMADEIWSFLGKQHLDNAANLTLDAHLSSICDWIVSL